MTSPVRLAEAADDGRVERRVHALDRFDMCTYDLFAGIG